MKNSLKLMIAPKRWVKKYFRNLVPEMAYLNVENFRIYFSLRDVSGPSFDLAYGGKNSFDNYEKRDKLLVDKFLNDGDVFFDVGANIGHFSFYFKRKYKNLKCFMFEPHPVLSKCIQETVQFGNIKDISLNEVALSNETNELEFFEDTFNDGGHSLISDQVSKRSKSHSFKVQAETLDNYFSKLNVDSIDMMKIDVQGAEFMLLEGAVETLNKYKPKIFVEVINSKAYELWDKLEAATGVGYSAYSPYLEEKISKDNRDDVFLEKKIDGNIEYNWLFVPN